jgi:hypothetical protein
MNDLDDLKRAMQSPPGYLPRELDLGEIMQAGGRLRRRRRLATGVGAAAAVVALLVGGSQLIGTRTNTGLRTPTAPAAAAPESPPVPTPDPSPSEATKKPLGDVIRTGLPSKQGEWLFYAVAIDEPALPDTHFGIMLGQRRKNGDIISSVLINETEGADRTPGFHRGEGPMVVDGGATPAFGYFVGKPYRITALVHGKTATASLHAWSTDPSVVVFWFDPATVGTGAQLTKLTAYDRVGKKLASAGNTGFGVG